MVMTTAKRLLWYNYTNTIHNGTSIDLNGIMAKWLSVIKHKVKAFTWMYNRSKEDSIDDWDLKGSWAKLENNEWTIIENFFFQKK